MTDWREQIGPGRIFYSIAEILAEQEKRRPPKYTTTPRPLKRRTWP